MLGQLRDEFPDITISKIRFLESQGLIDPGAHAVGLPEVLRPRRRPPALDPAPAEGALPAAQGDQGAPRRAPAGGGGVACSTPRPSRPPAAAPAAPEPVGDAGRARAPAPPRAARRATARSCPTLPDRRRRDATPASSRPAATGTYTRARARRRGRHRRRAGRASSRATGCSRRRATIDGIARCSTTTRSRSPGSRPGSSPTASRPATCACTALRRARGGAVRPGADAVRCASATRGAGTAAGASWSSWRGSDASCAPRSCATPCARRSPSDRRRAAAPETLLDEPTLARVRRRASAREISADHPDGVVLVGVLKGALIFLADLARAIRDDRRARSTSSRSRGYAPDSGGCGSCRTSTRHRAGATSWSSRTSSTPASRSRTCSTTCGGTGPRRLDVCTLLDRPARRIVPLDGALRRGVEIADVFVLGYGLHLRRPVPQPARRRGRPTARSSATDPTPTSATLVRIGAGGDGVRRPVLGWRPVRYGGARDPDVARRSPSRGPIEPADRAAPRGRRAALPADLHRPAGGDGDRLRPPGHGDAPADDPRPVQDRARRPRAPSSSRS